MVVNVIFITRKNPGLIILLNIENNFSQLSLDSRLGRSLEYVLSIPRSVAKFSIPILRFLIDEITQLLPNMVSYTATKSNSTGDLGWTHIMFYYIRDYELPDIHAHVCHCLTSVRCKHARLSSINQKGFLLPRHWSLTPLVFGFPFSWGLWSTSRYGIFWEGYGKHSPC